MMHSSTMAGSMPARWMASRTTIEPSCVAVNPFSAPRNLPVGVRTAETMTDSRTAHLDARDRIGAEQFLEPLQDERGRPVHFARPFSTDRVYEQHIAFELHMRGALHRRTDNGAPCKADLALGQGDVTQECHQGARNGMLKRTHPLILSSASWGQIGRVGRSRLVRQMGACVERDQHVAWAIESA